MRWGIETSFRALKYTIGLSYFHTKKQKLIEQEIFARLIMYNFTEIITAHVILSQVDTKLSYQVNFTIAVNVCQRFFHSWFNLPPPDVIELICKNTLPVRPNRKYNRRMHSKRAICFTYRVA